VRVLSPKEEIAVRCFDSDDLAAVFAILRKHCKSLRGNYKHKLDLVFSDRKLRRPIIRDTNDRKLVQQCFASFFDKQRLTQINGRAWIMMCGDKPVVEINDPGTFYGEICIPSSSLSDPKYKQPTQEELEFFRSEFESNRREQLKDYADEISKYLQEPGSSVLDSKLYDHPHVNSLILRHIANQQRRLLPTK